MKKFVLLVIIVGCFYGGLSCIYAFEEKGFNYRHLLDDDEDYALLTEEYIDDDSVWIDSVAVDYDYDEYDYEDDFIWADSLEVDSLVHYVDISSIDINSIDIYSLIEMVMDEDYLWTDSNKVDSISQILDSESLFEILAEKYKEVEGEKGEHYSTLRLHLLSSYYKSKEYEKASELENEIKTIDDNAEDYIADYVDFVDGCLDYFFEYDDWESASKVIRQAMSVVSATIGENNSLYSKLLDYQTMLETVVNLAPFIQDKDTFSKSEILSLGSQLTRSAISVAKITSDIRDRYAAQDMLRGMVMMNNIIGNYEEAINEAKELLQLYDRESVDYASVLCDLSCYVMDLGRYEEAHTMLCEAQAIFEKLNATVENIYVYSRFLTSLSKYYTRTGYFIDGEQNARGAIEILKMFKVEEDVAYIDALNVLSLCIAERGDYEGALNIDAKLLSILGKIDPQHTQYPILYATMLNNFADHCYSAGYSSIPASNEQKAIKILEENNLTETLDYGTYLCNLGKYYLRTGSYDSALEPLRGAIDVYKKLNATESPHYPTFLKTLASYYFCTDSIDMAISLCEEAMQIEEKTKGTEHPDFSSTLSKLATYYFLRGKYTETAKYAIEITLARNKQIFTTFSALTSQERSLFWNKCKPWFEEILPQYAYYIQTDSLIATAYDGALLSKGLLLNTELEMNKLLQEGGDRDSVVEAKYEALRTNRAILNKLYEKPIAERSIDTDSLEKVIQSQERELVQLSKAYGDYTKNLSIDWHDVQEKLGKDDVAIEFLSFPIKNDSIMYVALTLTKDDDVPHMTSLFEKKELDKVDNTAYYKTTDVSQLVWKPLSDVMEGKENVYFAPAGELHNIAIESIPLYGGDELVSDKWNMCRLSSTRSLALIKDKNEIERADVYGGLKYATDSLTLVEDSKKYPQRSTDFTVKAIADTLGRAGVAELSGAEEEAKEVNNTLLAMNIDTQLYSDSIGTEASFKALSGQRPNILHIATHGFYWTESEAKDMSYLGAMTMFNDDTRPRYVEDKALTRSGLFLTGVNHALHGGKLPEGVEDGILTAKEISTLDLRGLDLVVLSACQTGLGEITGDGVFGLQRGFKKAGANTIVMSLWKVDDDATKLLMTEFYHNLLSKGSKQVLSGEAKRKAFREAQNSLRNSKDPKLSDPHAWAAFILLDAID